MKLIDCVCNECEGRCELLVENIAQVTAADIEANAHIKDWLVVQADGTLRCKECGGLVQVCSWKANGHRAYVRDLMPVG